MSRWEAAEQRLSAVPGQENVESTRMTDLKDLTAPTVSLGG